MLIGFLVLIALSGILTVIALRIAIPILKSKKMGQKILDIGPRWHKSKEGTPTMGGLCFILPILLFSGITLAIRPEWIPRFLPVTLLAALCGVVGWIDDRAKLLKKQNEGLLPWQKFLLQLVAAGVFLFLGTVFDVLDTTLRIPYVGVTVELGWGYYVFALIFITGMVNSTNLTDGIDGLASSVTLVIAGFFALIAFCREDRELSILSGALIGGMIGFLVYNFHPARVFMGDTGSLFLGGLLSGMAFLIGDPLILVVAGFVYLTETISVMLQVSVFKLSGRKKRLFLMAPIHHHFEKLGWGEVKIVFVFSGVTLLLCVAAWFGLG